MAMVPSRRFQASDAGATAARPGTGPPGCNTGVGRRPQSLTSLQILPPVTLGLVIGVGFILRLIASIRLTSHVDEASSVLAAHATAMHGWPVLPSGTVYFQGATLSYLLAPLVWLGFGGLDDLTLMRFVPVVAGTVTIYLCYRLGVAVTGDVRVGVVMAGLVALDPVSVQWSGHIRMYGVLQAVVAGLAWAFILLLDRGPSPARVTLVIALSWAAVFTHVGASLVLAAMAVSVILVHRQDYRRILAFAPGLVLCGLAPVTLLTLNSILGAASVGAGDTSSRPFLTFVGDNLFQPLARVSDSFTLALWEPMTRLTTLVWLVPGVIVATATVLGGYDLLIRNRDRVSSPMRTATIALLAMYWLPVLVVGVFTASPKERYLLHVHVIGYLFVAVVIVRLVDRQAASNAGWSGRLGRAATAGVMSIAVLAIGATLVLRLAQPVVHPDYLSAMAYVAEHHEPGQPIIVALPAVGHLALDATAREDLLYLAGSEGQPRAQRYTRVTPDDRLIDYWVGADAIVTTDGLRDILLENADAWVIVDEERLSADWAYAGDIERLLGELTTIEHRTLGGGLVLRVAPPISAASPAAR